LTWNIQDEFPKIKSPKKQYGGQIQNGGQPEYDFLSECAFCDLICRPKNRIFCILCAEMRKNFQKLKSQKNNMVAKFKMMDSQNTIF
jgi:hypothetical protein